jgi:hypothetical protein
MPFGEKNIPQKGVVSDQRRMNDHEKGSWGMSKARFDGFKMPLFIMAIIFFLIFIAADSFFITKSGYISIYENPLKEESKKLEVYKTPGIHLKMPFFQVTRYKQVWIVDFGTGYAGEQLRESKAPIELRFSDTYKTGVPATFRYKLPTSENRIKAIHEDFTTHEFLIDALLIPISRDAMVSTAALYTGEEFFQGGISQFKAVLEDQVQNGTYKTKLIEVEVRRGNMAVNDPQFTQSTNFKWKTEPVRDKNGRIERLETKSISDYGIELKQVTLGVPVPEPELEQLLADKKKVTRATIKKADELALILEDQKIQLVNIEKEKQTRLATILKEEAIQLANTKRDVKIQLANVKRDEKIERAKKAEGLALVDDNKKIQLANVEKAEKVQLANVEKDKKIKLAETERAEKVQLANVEKETKTKLARKAEELALVKETEKIQLANVGKDTKVKRARKTEELILVQDEQKVQVAEEVKNLAIVQEKQKVQEAEKLKDLAITLAETKVQMAKKEEELAIAQAELKIQKANFEAAQFEAKAILEKGNAEAGVLKAKYEARVPEIFHAEMKKEIAEIIYSNLKGINVTMPHNIVNLGESDGNSLQTNLDVLSSFATINVMEGMEKKALENSSALK